MNTLRHILNLNNPHNIQNMTGLAIPQAFIKRVFSAITKLKAAVKSRIQLYRIRKFLKKTQKITMGLSLKNMVMKFIIPRSPAKIRIKRKKIKRNLKKVSTLTNQGALMEKLKRKRRSVRWLIGSAYSKDCLLIQLTLCITHLMCKIKSSENISKPVCFRTILKRL